MAMVQAGHNRKDLWSGTVMGGRTRLVQPTVLFVVRGKESGGRAEKIAAGYSAVAEWWTLGTGKIIEASKQQAAE